MDGTVATIFVLLQLTMLAATPLKVTVLSRCVAWKPVSLIVTCVPDKPSMGEKELM
jgi:hypothetical protein